MLCYVRTVVLYIIVLVCVCAFVGELCRSKKLFFHTDAAQVSECV